MRTALTGTHTIRGVVRRRRALGILLACLGALVIAAAVAFAAQQAKAAAAPNPSPFLVTRSGITYYDATSQTTGTRYTGTLKSVIESAVGALNSFSTGGTIRFSAGTFDLGSDSLQLHSIHDIVFEGAGRDQTTIQNNNSDAADTEPFNTNSCKRITIRNLAVSAGGAVRSTSQAIDLDNGSYCRVDNVRRCGGPLRLPPQMSGDGQQRSLT